jgi:hypothetical protein
VSFIEEKLTTTTTTTTTTKPNLSKCKQGSSPVPFPRGGRQIGGTYIPSQPYTSTQKTLSRSNSGEPHKYDQGNLTLYLLSSSFSSLSLF